MYKHEKLFDIVNTIESFVNLSFGKEMSENRYRDAYNKLISVLPEEYKKNHRYRFQNFMAVYHQAKNIDKKHKSNFRRKLYKHLKIDYINDINENMRELLQ